MECGRGYEMVNRRVFYRRGRMEYVDRMKMRKVGTAETVTVTVVAWRSTVRF